MESELLMESDLLQIFLMESELFKGVSCAGYQ